MQSVIFDVEFRITLIGTDVDVTNSIVAMMSLLITVVVDAESIPTVNMLQGGLLNDEGYLREFFLFVKRLLKCATTDPGFVNAKEVHLMHCLRVVLCHA